MNIELTWAGYKYNALEGLNIDAQDCFDVCVIGGCGRVGLPLSIALASKGKKVCSFDINKDAIKMVQNGKMPFKENGTESLLPKVLRDKTLTLSSKPDVISRSEIVVLVVGTPVDQHLNPELSAIKNVIDEYLDLFVEGQTIILRSTVYPGTSKWVTDFLQEHEKRIHVAYCPERVLEGKSIEELENLPQIISSFSEEGLQKSFELFKVLTDEIITLEPMEAELTKLFNNVWRYIKFATANQFFMIANDMGVDFYKIHHAMTHNYTRAKDFPTPGFTAGPCLFKDTMQLGSCIQNSTYLGHTAMLINEGLPNYILRKLQEKYCLSKITIGILGMAFKGEHDDNRESLSYKLKKIFEFYAKSVLCSDPFVADERLVPMETVLNKCEIIIIASPHTLYKSVNFGDKKIIDIWNILGSGAVI